jgi:periplasmic divalent cation tolerance protein
MPEPQSELALVVSTLASADDALRLARRLVDERLIACGNVVPGLTSVFRWEGRVEESAEVLLVMKTRSALVERLCERVTQLHPYQVPELVALRPSHVADAYGRWVVHETTEVNG